MDRNTVTPAEEGGIVPLDLTEQKTFLDRLRNVQGDIRSLQADFVEERSIPSLKTPLRFEGRLYYHRKGLFFMEYRRPFNYILRVQGKEALFYVEGSQTADMVDISSVQGLPKHGDLFGWNPDAFKGQVWEDAQGYRLEETAQGGRRLTILLDRKTLLVRRIRFEDDGGDVTEITLSDMKVNHELPLSVLQFTLPKGIKVNRLSQP